MMFPSSPLSMMHVKLGLELWICSEVMHASHCGGSALLVWLHPSILQLALNIYVKK